MLSLGCGCEMESAVIDINATGEWVATAVIDTGATGEWVAQLTSNAVGLPRAALRTAQTEIPSIQTSYTQAGVELLQARA